MPNRTLIKNVNVITMNDDTVLQAQDVLIEGSFIKAIGSKSSLNHAIDTEIEGTGKYLMPGLFDMHAHVNEKRFLNLFLMNGVTSVRDLGNTDEGIFKLKQDIDTGKLIGPKLFVSGKILEGDPPFWKGFNVIKSKQQAIAAVKELKAKGADQVKVYHTLNPAIHKIIVDEAHTLGMKITGHIPQELNPIEALTIGQDGIEHLTSISGYIGRISYEDANEVGYEGWSKFTGYEIKEKELDKLRDTFKANKAYFCPTLIVHQQISRLSNYHSLVQETDPTYTELDYINEAWNPASKKAATNISGVKPLWFKNYGVIYEGAKRTVKTIHGAAMILAGTDTPNPFVVPGFSLHQELKLLVESGLSNFEALQAATINPAHWLGMQTSLGTIGKGKLANLLLLKRNPLNNISNTQTIEQVILNGKAYSVSSFQEKAKLK